MSKRRRQSLLTSRMPDSTASTLAPAVDYVPDYVVLKPTDASDADNSDEWVTFDLVDAIVLDTNGSRIENGLMVERRGPFVVRGRLKIERSDKEQLARLQPNYKRATSVNIEIRNCQKYSIGQDGNGALIYLSGPCGWFELEPSPTYMAMHMYMSQCVDMYWSLAKTYGLLDPIGLQKWQAKHKKGLPSVEEALCQYAIDVGDGSTLSSAMERCRQFAPFLAHHMASEPGTGPIWPHTSIYRTLCDISEAQRGQEPHVPSPRPPGYRMASPAPVSPSQRRRSAPATPAELPRLPPRPKTRRSLMLPAKIPTTPMHAAPAATPASDGDVYAEGLRSLVTALSQYWLPNEKNKAAPNGGHRSVLCYLWLVYSIKDYKCTTNLVSYYAKDLLGQLELQDANGKAIGASTPWTQTEFYHWLAGTVGKWQPGELDQGLHPFVFRKRQNATKVLLPGSGSSQATPPRATPVAAGKGKQPRTTGGLRLTSASKKRKATSAALDDSEPANSGNDGNYSDVYRTPKLIKTSPFFQDEANENEMDKDDDATRWPDQGDQDEDAANLATVRVVVEVERMPSKTPRGPLGMWRCDFNGCKTYVRACDDQKSRIRQHLQTHETTPASLIDPTENELPLETGSKDGRRDRYPEPEKQPHANADLIQLAVAEGKQSLLPINHLLDKIKRFGSQQEKAAMAVVVDGRHVPVPAPIRRRVLY